MKKGIQPAKLNRDDFSCFYSNISYFLRIYFPDHNYEISLEPCDFGFDVAVYDHQFFDETTLIGKKICTKLPGYTGDHFHEKERRDDAWEAALKISGRLLKKMFPGKTNL
jgi:hypothetical protein